jgi:hypothetical protein
MIYYPLSKQEVAPTPVTSQSSSLSHYSRKPLFETYYINYKKYYTIYFLIMQKSKNLCMVARSSFAVPNSHGHA